MSIETINDANTAEGSSPSAELETEGLISTIEPPVESGADTLVKGAADAKDAQAQDGLKDQKKDEKPDTTDAAKEQPFHLHPRFKEMESTIQGLRQTIQQLQQQPAQKQEPELDFVPLQTLDDEKIAEWEQTDKRGLYANFLRQARHEIRNELFGEIDSREKNKQQFQTIRGTIEAFAGANKGDAKHGIPSFDELWESGEIKNFMAQKPGHNAMSAYNELIAPKVRDRDEKVLRQKIMDEIKAKGAAGSITQSTVGSRAVDTVDPELKDPDKFGGAKAVAIKRAALRLAGKL